MGKVVLGENPTKGHPLSVAKEGTVGDFYSKHSLFSQKIFSRGHRRAPSA